MAAFRVRTLTIKPAGRPNSDINITPLVDVVLVLLIIFMVVTPLLEKDIGVRVPATEQVEEKTEVPPDQLVVHLGATGDLTINDEKVPRDEYVDRLRGILARKGPKDKLVFMVADEAASYGNLVSVIDGAKQAGAETIGMATQLAPEAPSAQAPPSGGSPPTPASPSGGSPPIPPAPPAPPQP
jgi:biopolymer transport protein ExbD